MLVEKGIHLVNIPLPIRLESVNCYLLEGKDGWAIIDTGLNYPGAKEKWTQALREIGIGFQDITKMVVTHFHVDHVGLAGWFQERSGCKVYISDKEGANLGRFWDVYLGDDQELYLFLIKSGLEQDEAETLCNLLRNVDRVLQPYPDFEFVKDGDFLRLGDRLWEVLVTPGHTSGHICLYCNEEGLLLSGDQLLPTITSNISIVPAGATDPLEDYLNSLRRLEGLHPRLVLPAHGPCFDNYQERIRELYRHHEERLELILRSVGSGKHAAAISDEVFGTDLGPVERFMAVGETLAHLKVLIRQGLVAEREGIPTTFIARGVGSFQAK